MTLSECCMQIQPLDEMAMQAAQQHWNQLAKPLHSLGRLEDMIVQLAGIHRSAQLEQRKKVVLIFCADNGIVEEDVTQTGQEVTATVAENFTKGIATVNSLAQVCQADVMPIDIGIARDMTCKGIANRKIAYGTKNFAKEPAMTRTEVEQAILTGIQLVKEQKEQGYNLIITGEMGIGNTTPSSAIVAVLTGTPVETVTGRGSGVRGEVIRKKIKLIEQGITLNKPDPSDAIDVLAKVGGPEIGAMAGLMLGAASAIAQGIRPEAAQYFIGSHNSAEPGHKLIMDHIGVTMYMDLGLCLGEGTGAALFFPLLDAATRVLSEMKTLPELDITVPR